MVDKATISRYMDAMSVLGLRGADFDSWSDDQKLLWLDVADLDEKQHTKSGAGMVYKSEESKALEFAIPPMVHKAASNFYCGPRTIDNETPSWFRYRPPGPTCKAAARASLGLPDTAPEDARRKVFTAREVARASLGL